MEVVNYSVSTSRENGCGTPKSHISVSNREAVAMATQLLALRGDNKVEMCLKTEGGEGRWGWLCTEGGMEINSKCCSQSILKPQGASASDKRRNT